MVWTLVYNVILTERAKSLFQAQHQWSRNECQRKSIMPGSYVCLLMVPLIRVPLNKGQCTIQTTKWKAYHSTQFADIVALESANAVGVAKGIEKELEAVDIDNELLKEKLVGSTFDVASVMTAKSGGVAPQLQVKIGRSTNDIRKR